LAGNEEESELSCRVFVSDDAKRGSRISSKRIKALQSEEIPMLDIMQFIYMLYPKLKS
jgi:hypothetical protein